MEPKGSLPCSQELASYSLSNDHLNIILPFIRCKLAQIVILVIHKSRTSCMFYTNLSCMLCMTGQCLFKTSICSIRMAHFLTSSFGYEHHEATPSCFSFVAETGVISLLLCYADHVNELPPKDFHLPVVICATFFLFCLNRSCFEIRYLNKWQYTITVDIRLTFMTDTVFSITMIY